MSIQETKIYDASNNPIAFQPIQAVAVVPHDTTTFNAGVLYIGSTGNVKVQTKGGDTITFTNVANSFLLPVQVIQVFSTGTTATSMIILR